MSPSVTQLSCTAEDPMEGDSELMSPLFSNRTLYFYVRCGLPSLGSCECSLWNGGSALRKHEILFK